MLMMGAKVFEPAPHESSLWDADDDVMLIEMYNGGESVSYIADVLERSEASIAGRKRLLQKKGILSQRADIRIKRSLQSQEFVKDHFLEDGLVYCAEHTGLAKKTVREYARKMGLKTCSHQHPWSTTEVAFLFDTYWKKGYEYCAQILGRTGMAVRIKASDLRLTIPRGTCDRHKVA